MPSKFIIDHFRHSLQLAEEFFKERKLKESLNSLLQAAEYLNTATNEEAEQMTIEYRQQTADSWLLTIAEDFEKNVLFNFAEAMYQLIVEFESDSLSYEFLGEYYLRHGEYAKSKNILKKALDLAGVEAKIEVPDLYNSLGEVCLKLGDYKEAASFLVRAKEIEFYSGENEMNLNNYGGSTIIQNAYLYLFDHYFPKEYLDFCILLLHEAMYQGDNYSNDFLVNLHSRRGMCYYKKNNFNEASFSFKKVLEREPNNSNAKEMLNKINVAA
ncbi:MAG: tetratricopeptide repeat protein [Bacteroidota bacterium]|jgi:uncharacterized protein HemY